MKPTALIVLVIALAVNTVVAQSYKNSTVYSFKNITTQHGLPSNTVYHITQDTKGNIWFATDKGVSRYDGVKFKNWSIKEGIVDLDIIYLNEDSKNRIWAANTGGGLFYIKDEKIYNVYNSRNISKVRLSSWITTSIEDKEGNLWFSSFLKETVKINRDLQPSLFFYPHNSNNHPDYPDGRLVSDFYLNDIGNPEVVFSGHGNTSFDPETDRVSSKNPGLFYKTDRALRINSSIYIISKLNKIYILKNSKKYDSINMGDKMKRIVKIIKQNEASFFVSDGRSIYQINHINYKIKDAKKLIEEEGVDKIFIDREKNVWINSIHKGVFILFDTLVRNIDDKKLSSTKIHAIEIFNQKIVSGSDNGKLFITDNEKTIEDSSISRLILDGRGRINQIVKIDKNLLVISQENFLCILKKNKLYRLPMGSKNITLFDSSIGIGFSNNCYIIPNNIALNPEKQILNNNNINDFSILPGYRTHKITGIDYKNVYIATSEGLFNLDIRKQITNHLNKEKELRYPIRFMEQIATNKLIVGIDGIGLIFIENNKIRNRYYFDNPESVVINRLKKIDNYLYMCTNKGLIIYEILTDGIKKKYTIDNSDGIRSSSVNDVLLTKNEYIIGSDSGVSIVDFKYLEAFKANDKKKPASLYKILPEESTYVEDNTIYIKPGLKVILALNTHTNQNFGSTKLRIKYTPYENWSEQSGAFAIIENKSNKSGYPTSVQYKIKHGKWTELNSHIIIKDEPSDLEKFIFDKVNQKIAYYLGLIFFFILALTATYIVFSRKTMLKQRLLINKAEIKPHMLMNSLSSLQYFYSHGDFESGNHQIQNYKSFLSSFLNSSDLDFIDLWDELITVKKYLSAECQKNNRNISYSINITNILENDRVFIPSMIIQPIIENSIKHAFTEEITERNISISIMAYKKDYKEVEENQYTPSLIVLNVSDNGKGFLPSDIGSGLGTKSVIEKISLLNRKYNMSMSLKYLQNPEGQGTLVQLKIPITKTTKKLNPN